MKKKCLIILSIFITIFIFLIFRVYIIQRRYDNGTYTIAYKGDIQNEYISQKKFTIYDCNDKKLIDSKIKYVLVIDSRLFRLNNMDTNLENILMMNYILKSVDKKFTLDNVISSGGKYYCDKLGEDEYLKLLECVSTLKGVYIYEYEIYDNSKAWSIENILINIDKSGSNNNENLENILYSQIKDNKNIMMTFKTDNYGCYNNVSFTDNNNKNIKTTLDKEWQEKCRNVLQNQKYYYLNNIGLAICDSSTGAIKVLCQKDEKMPNVLVGASGVGYPPGSIFKIVDEIAAMNKGDVDLNQTYTCTGKYCKRDGKPNPHGTVDINEALRVSCNGYFMNIGRQTGFDEIEKTAKKLNLGKKTLNLSHEASGILPVAESGINNIAIGQTFNVSPIQMLGVINTVCNNGVYSKPYIIDGIEDKNGNVQKINLNETKKILSENNAQRIKLQLMDVVNNGSGAMAQVKGITVGGKTGTAEDGEYNDVWFLGFFEYKGKSYSAVIFAPKLRGKNPDGELYGGGSTAAPILHDVIESIITK